MVFLTSLFVVVKVYKPYFDFEPHWIAWLLDFLLLRAVFGTFFELAYRYLKIPSRK